MLLKPDSWWNMHHTDSWSHLKIRRENIKTQGKPQYPAVHLSPCVMSNTTHGGMEPSSPKERWGPGSRRLPMKFWHPRKPELPEPPVRALLLCTANTGNLNGEPCSPCLMGATSGVTPSVSVFPLWMSDPSTHQRVHLCTYLISALHILAPAPQPIHSFLFMLWTSRLTTFYTSYQPNETTATTISSVVMCTNIFYLLEPRKLEHQYPANINQQIHYVFSSSS